ncbi:MAG: PAS domain S-box protein [Chloroflexi bacterium]|nr:PAS domain S-box protein [Chloroflexota bacterium]
MEHDNFQHPVFLFRFSADQTARFGEWLAQTPFAPVHSVSHQDELAPASGIVIANCAEVKPGDLAGILRRLPVIALTANGDGVPDDCVWDYLPAVGLTRDLLLRSLRAVAQRHRLEMMRHQLQASEARFHNLVARNSDGILVVNDEGVIRFINPAAERLFNRPLHDLLDSPLGFPVSAGEITELEILQGRGEVATVEMRVEQTEWDGFPAYLLSLRDITERKRTEQALNEAVKTNYQFAAAIASFSVGVIITDPGQPDNPIVFVNAGFTSITGYRPDEVIGQNWRFLHGPDTDAASVQRIENALQTVRPLNCIILNYRKDGTPFWNEVNINPVFDDDGHLINFVALHIDVTLRKQAEQALLEQERLRVALDKEKELSSVKNLFMSTISHEFRTPLAVIQTAAEMLDRYAARMNDQQRHERLMSILTQVRHLEVMLDEISVIIRAELNRMEFQPIYLDVKQFCQMVIDDVQSTVGSNHRLIFTVEDGVYEMSVDAKLLRHILNNLLGNAVKYSKPGSEVRLDLSFDGDFVVFRIGDQGIGIPEQDQPRLFEAFYRGSNVDAIGGTGLGLKVVHDCVMLHGGEIAVESRLGQGTTMIVRLPRRQTAVDED